MKPIEEYSDEELLAIIRQGGNINVPGGLYQRANNEWQIRQQKKLLEMTKSGKKYWYEKPIGIITLAVVAGVIVGAILLWLK